MFVYRDTLTCYGMAALSLPISHGMHLMVPAHPCFFWVICHLSRTSFLKEPEQEPQNRLSTFPTARPYPLTFDPWPTISCIGWVQIGEAWALCVLNFCVCPKLARCICHGLETPLHILLPVLDFLWHGLLSDSSFSMAHSLRGLGFTWLWAFPPSAHSFALFYSLCISCCTILPFLLWCY